MLRLRAATNATGSRREKSIVMIFLSGGPSHLDMYDMKPQAPREYRGEFNPIRTNVPGIEICELMPMQAKIADKFTILRGCQLANLHSGNAFYSGFAWQENPRASVPGEAQRPALGSVVSKLRGGAADMVPYVSVQNPVDWERAYYLGVEHEPFRVSSGSSESLDNMQRSQHISSERLRQRADLLQTLDRGHRDSSAKGIDAFQARALEIVGSGRVHAAFDVEKEPAHVRARYGEGQFIYGRHPGSLFLQARRLLEASVSVVTISIPGWDTHANNFSALRQLLPPIDRALHALVTDLDERGMLDDTILLMGGEFGRTPRIGDVTPDGRSHWPEAGFLWMAGGGIKTGQIIGGTDDRGERVIGAPIQIQNVLATLYPLLGIDPALTFRDHNGRPQYLLENREPVAGLV